MMRRKILLGAFATLAPFSTALALTCDFVGGAVFDATPSEGANPRFAQLTFRDVSASSLAIRFGKGSATAPAPESVYVIDGKSHLGDGRFSGDSYVADCDATKMVITSQWRQFPRPIVYEFNLSGPGRSSLSFLEKFGTSTHANEYTRRP